MKPCSERRYDWCTWDHKHDECADGHNWWGRSTGDEPKVPATVETVYAWCGHLAHLELSCGHWHGIERMTRDLRLERRAYVGIDVLCGWTHGPDGKAA